MNFGLSELLQHTVKWMNAIYIYLYILFTFYSHINTVRYYTRIYERLTIWTDSQANTERLQVAIYPYGTSDRPRLERDSCK